MLFNELPQDILNKINDYLMKCKKCDKLITTGDIIDNCEICNSVWCCSYVTNIEYVKKDMKNFVKKVCYICSRKLRWDEYLQINNEVNNLPI